jgi:flagellin
MGLSINQNIAAINSYRNLSNTQNDLSKSLEKLSSGFRINRAADDAAGLAISEGLRSQIGGLKVAGRNAQDGISVVQTAEGALTETHAILQRLRDLAVQGANDSNNDKARDNIKTEADSLVKELNRIAESTNFNGTKLLNGDVNGAGGTTLTFQVGADGDTASAITVDLAKANVSSIAASLGFDSVTGNVAATGTIVPGAGGTPGTPASEATRDADVDVIAGWINTLNGNTALATDGSETLSSLAAALPSTHSIAMDGSDFVVTLNAVPGTPGANDTIDAFDVSNHVNAQASVNTIDALIADVSTARAELGAYQNRFEHTIKNINVAVENLSASESRIRDTDMAQEMMNFTKNQILSQAGTAMLAQANQIPQGVLSLLR